MPFERGDTVAGKLAELSNRNLGVVRKPCDVGVTHHVGSEFGAMLGGECLEHFPAVETVDRFSGLHFRANAERVLIPIRKICSDEIGEKRGDWR